MIFGASTSRFCAGGTVRGEVAGACTLLGPEGPGTMKVVAGASGPAFCFWLCAGDGGGYRPYFENYTVDASIFETIFFGRFV